ncbi:hypothetical protein, partial [Mesorhizobium sp.]|uniref:hypothetical protein n=1 Tax=Mesorhizobium sp. TaxID=1871066 RepID=UPI0025BB4BF7
PHPAAATFSPYSDGEKGFGRNAGTYLATPMTGETVNDGVFLPVTIRGEMPGRTMRGSAMLDICMSTGKMQTWRPTRTRPGESSWR